VIPISFRKFLLRVSPPDSRGPAWGRAGVREGGGESQGLLTLHLQDLVTEVGLDVVGAVGRQNQPQAAEGDSRQPV